ncbi:MFS transporter, partial [Streptomyces tendae]
GLIAGVAGVAAPFVMLGGLLLLSSGVALRAPSAGLADPRGSVVGQDVPDRAGGSRPCREAKG